MPASVLEENSTYSTLLNNSTQPSVTEGNDDEEEQNQRGSTSTVILTHSSEKSERVEYIITAAEGYNNKSNKRFKKTEKWF